MQQLRLKRVVCFWQHQTIPSSWEQSATGERQAGLTLSGLAVVQLVQLHRYSNWCYQHCRPPTRMVCLQANCAVHLKCPVLLTPEGSMGTVPPTMHATNCLLSQHA